MFLLPMCSVKDRRSRPFTIMERRKVDVVAGLFSDFCKQGAVDPVYDRSIHLSGSTEDFRIIGKLSDVNILNLQMAPRMKNQNGNQETHEIHGTKLKSLFSCNDNYEFI